jgi:hypothetical protein
MITARIKAGSNCLRITTRLSLSRWRLPYDADDASAA